MEDWAEIRRLHRAEGMPVRAIARKLGVGRNTVRWALAAAGPPRYQRPAKGSIADAVEPQIRELLAQWPEMPATVIAERIAPLDQLGFVQAYRRFHQRVVAGVADRADRGVDA